MSTEITVQNTLNGEISIQRAEFLDDPHFAQFYVEVPSDTKPFLNGFYTPKTADEFREAYPNRVVNPLAIEAPVDEPVVIPDVPAVQAPKPATNKKEAK